jgi:hypothetical protein
VVADIEKRKRSGYRSNNFFSRVPLPTPLGPVTTINLPALVSLKVLQVLIKI